MKKSDEILAKMIPLSTPVKLPTTFIEICRIAWESFTVGRDYESQLQKEEEVKDE
jgi:hypothetical protein